MSVVGTSSQSFLRNLEEKVTKESSIRKDSLRKHVRVRTLNAQGGCAQSMVTARAASQMHACVGQLLQWKLCRHHIDDLCTAIVFSMYPAVQTHSTLHSEGTETLA